MKLTISIGPSGKPVMSITGEKDYEKILSLLEKTIQKCAEEGVGWAKENAPDVIHKDLALAMLGLILMRKSADIENARLLDEMGRLFMSGLGHHKGEVFRKVMELRDRVENGEKIE